MIYIVWFWPSSEVSELIKQNPEYARLCKIKLTRDLVKRSIMTIPIQSQWHS